MDLKKKPFFLDRVGWGGGLVGELGGQEAWDTQSYDKKKKGTTPKIVNSLNFYEV